MKKITLSILAMLVAGHVIADEVSVEYLAISFTTNGASVLSVTNDNISGFVEEIVFVTPSGTTSGWSFVSAPTVGSAVTLGSTNSCIANTVVRPRVFTTDKNGAVTSTATKYLMKGDTHIFTVSNVVTTVSNITYKAIIKTSNSGGQ